MPRHTASQLVPDPPEPVAVASRHPLPRPWALAGTALALLLAWQLASVLLLSFAGLLLALALLQATALLRRHWQLAPRPALFVVVLTLVLMLVVGSWLAGAGIVDQLQSLRETLPRALAAVQKWLSGHAPGRWLLEAWAAAAPEPGDWQGLIGVAGNTVSATVGAIGSLALVVVIGLYLAADPQTYRRGPLRLLPPSKQALAAQTLDAAGRQLSRWLLGQGVSMLAVGVLTAAGLLLIGMPLALPLGLIAGVLDFVPYFGPVISGVFIVAVALADGESTALWAALVCFAVQQVEAYVVQPLAQRWAVHLSPVLGLLSVLIFGVLFGLPGVLLAVPLMVLTTTLVDELYVRGPGRERQPGRRRPADGPAAR